MLDGVVKPFETAKRERYLAMTRQASGTSAMARLFGGQRRATGLPLKQSYTSALDQYPGLPDDGPGFRRPHRARRRRSPIVPALFRSSQGYYWILLQKGS